MQGALARLGTPLEPPTGCAGAPPTSEGEDEILRAFAQLAEHEDELAELLAKVRQSRRQLAALIRRIRTERGAKEFKTGVH